MPMRERNSFNMTAARRPSTICLLYTSLAVFYGVFGAVAPKQEFAFSKTAQYFQALTVVGRFDLLLIYLMTIVLLFYYCLSLIHIFFFLSLSEKREFSRKSPDFRSLS